MSTHLIVAIDQNHGIGKNGDLPWKLKNDMQFFRTKTAETQDPNKQNAIIMGRATWESIPEKFRPLPNRQNIVLTRNNNYTAKGANVFHSLEDAITNITDNIEKIFIIGGGQIYKEAIEKNIIDGMYITKIQKTFDCDTFFPEIPQYFKKTQSLGKVEENGVEYEYELYEKKS